MSNNPANEETEAKEAAAGNATFHLDAPDIAEALVDSLTYFLDNSANDECDESEEDGARILSYVENFNERLQDPNDTTLNSIRAKVDELSELISQHLAAGK